MSVHFKRWSAGEIISQAKRILGTFEHQVPSMRDQIQLIVFDLDRVLLDTRPYWMMALNGALIPTYSDFEISPEEYDNLYDGLPFTSQLSILAPTYRIPVYQYGDFTARFYEHLASALTTVEPDPDIKAVLSELKRRNFLLYVHTALPFQLAKDTLLRMSIFEYVDWLLSSDDVKKPLPHPETFYRLLTQFGGSASHALAVQDHPSGREAAAVAGLHILSVSTPAELTLTRLLGGLSHLSHYVEAQTLSRLNAKLSLQVLIPIAKPTAAGEVPSFWRTVAGRPLIASVLDNLAFRGRFIFVVLKDHNERYNLSERLPSIAAPYGAADVVVLKEPANGAALTCLAAEHIIDRGAPLVIANGDQYMLWSPTEFLEAAARPGVVGAVSSFAAVPSVDTSGFSYLVVTADGDNAAGRTIDPSASASAATGTALSPNGITSPTSAASPSAHPRNPADIILAVRDDQPPCGTAVAVTGVFYWKSAGRFLDDAKATVEAGIMTRGMYYVHNVLQMSLLKEAEAPADVRGVFVSPRIEQGVASPSEIMASLTRMREIAASIGLPRTGPLMKFRADAVTPAHGASAQM